MSNDWPYDKHIANQTGGAMFGIGMNTRKPSRRKFGAVLHNRNRAEQKDASNGVLRTIDGTLVCDVRRLDKYEQQGTFWTFHTA